MRNRPTPIYESRLAQGGHSAFDVDAEPGVRLVWLFVAMTFPLLIVAGRVLYLQGFVAEGFAVETRHEIATMEPIPARHGRILASDGSVLAFDEEQFRVLVHYRWLEEPPDERWLRDEAMARLRRSERRDKQKVEQAKVTVLERRETLWRSLAEVTDLAPDKLAAVRARVQQRIERIYRLVDERRMAGSRAAPSAEDLEAEKAATPASVAVPNWEEAWQLVKRELTTTPTRERHEPLRIPEQSDYHLLIEDVSLDVVAEIETHPEQYPGVRTEVASRRVYPRGRVAPHLVGYRGEIDASELSARRAKFPKGDPLDYQPGDSIGRSGIEQSYEHVLRGVRGQRKIVRDRNGTIVGTEVVRPPQPGRDVVLNLSVELQEKATALLEERVEGGSTAATPESAPSDETDPSTDAVRRPAGGCIIAIDVRTGAILAAATAPTFDVNDFLSGSEDVRQDLLSDQRRPMFPRATQMTLPPGSVFKAVSAIAALQSGRIDPDHQIECIGYLKDPNKLRCYHSLAHYGTDLTKAIARSCNVYFFKAAQTLGPQPLVRWADAFGFGERTGIDVPGERRGHVPRPPERAPKDRTAGSSRIELASHERPIADSDLLILNSPWKNEPESSEAQSSRSRKPEPWYEGDTLGLAIGQSRLTVTPLQIARLMAAIANDGWLVTPHVAREIGARWEGEPPADRDDGMEQSSGPSDASPPRAVATAEPIEPERHRIAGLSTMTLARVREGLEQVVSHPQGTGFKSVRMKEVAIAGKTGTAEIGGGRPDHAWFAGYVPADRPQVAFVVVLEQAGSGGKVAGPVAKKLVQLLLEQGIIRSR